MQIEALLGTHHRTLCVLMATIVLVLSARSPAATPESAIYDFGRGPRVQSLPALSKHWVWVNDLVFPHLADGMAYLIDGDSGRYLGTLSTGYNFSHLVLPHDQKTIYSPETYFSRGTRGTRTDVVTIYDAGTLTVLDEIVIPPKRSSNLPMMANEVLTDDDRFLLIYNFTPAQSVTIVDTQTKKYRGEIETPGCALIYPTGARSFFSVCGNGALLLVDLDNHGVARSHRTEPIFDPQHDPVKEKAVRINGIWYFVSYAGHVFGVDATVDRAFVRSTWWLTSASERSAGWRTGGLQELAADSTRSRLYALMHRGPSSTHKDPGKDVWVYDVTNGMKVQEFTLKALATSIVLTSDLTPLLFALQMDSADLDVYDGDSGKFVRAIGRVGTTPTLLVAP
jgi:methylamine dehydrogenase heavy chain